MNLSNKIQLAEPQVDFSRLRSIALFRALQLGDLICAIPAMRAIRKAAPQAKITLIGLPWSKIFAERFHSYVDDWIEFPGFSGMPEQPFQYDLFKKFISRIQQIGFDFIFQMHGSGTITNPLISLFNADSYAGFYKAGEYCPARGNFLLWNDTEHEILRLLRLLTYLGIPSQGEELEFPRLDLEYQKFSQARENIPLPGTYICIHPGARFPSRRWPVQRFAEVADRLYESGWKIVVTGTAHEADLTRLMVREMKHPVLDLGGKTDLGTLAILIEEAQLVICNDTGISHITSAVGTPSIVVCCGSDPRRWAPLNQAKHQTIFAKVPCRPCMYFDCPIKHPCADEISAELVFDAALAFLIKHSKKK